MAIIATMRKAAAQGRPLPGLLARTVLILAGRRCYLLTRRRGAKAAILLLLAALAVLGGRAACPRRRPDVILITIDALRADALSSPDNPLSGSPFLDALARENVLFTQAVASSFCTQPAMASLMTGKVPSFEGVDRWDPFTYYGFARLGIPGEKPGLTGNVRTLAEILGEAGYQTAGFSTNPYLSGKTNFGQGFSQYEDFEEWAAQTQWKALPLAFSCSAPAPVVFAQARKWLEAKKPGPAFLWIHLMDVHFPYLPPPLFDRVFDRGYLSFDDLTLNRTYQAMILAQHQQQPQEEFKTLGELGISEDELIGHMKNLYYGKVRATDREVEAFWNYLRGRTQARNSLLVITSDHGEEFREHGRYSHHGYTGGKEEMVRIPLIMSFPAREGLAGLSVDAQVRIIDVAPTILDYAGAGRRERREMDGVSLLPLLRGEGDPPRIAWMSGPGFQMLRTPAWKHVRYTREGKEELFQLQEDPGEARNLAADLPERAGEMRRLFGEIARRARADRGGRTAAAPPLPAGSPWMDEATRQRLRALGYAE